MNELIQDLADRAIGSMPRDWIQTHDWNIPDEFLEKFAGLIVGECIDIIEKLPPGYKDYRDQIEDTFRRACVTEIKQQLGVHE